MTNQKLITTFITANFAIEYSTHPCSIELACVECPFYHKTINGATHCGISIHFGIPHVKEAKLPLQKLMSIKDYPELYI